MFVPCNHFLLSRFSYHLELGADHSKYPEEDENFLAHEFVFISLMSTGFFFRGIGFAQFILFYYFLFNMSSFVTHRKINVRF